MCLSEQIFDGIKKTPGHLLRVINSAVAPLSVVKNSKSKREKNSPNVSEPYNH